MKKGRLKEVKNRGGVLLMHIREKRPFSFSVIALILLAATALALVIEYETIVKYIEPPPEQEGQIPPPLEVSTSNSTNLLPASIKDKIVHIALRDDAIRKILDKSTFKVANVLPSTDTEGKLVGGCALISFPKPIWLEFNTSDAHGRPLEYIGWVKQLMVCVDLSREEVSGIVPSLGLREVPREPPPTASTKAKELFKASISTAKKFLQETYGLNESAMELVFYSIKNGVAYVSAKPKTNDKLQSVIILLKIDAKNMEVIEAKKYPVVEVYINPKYTNLTAGR